MSRGQVPESARARRSREAAMHRDLAAASREIAEARAAAWAEAKAQAAAERAQAAPSGPVDLAAAYAGCTEALWAANGRWYPVVRWSKKSVTVRMPHGTERIPHEQVAGGRRDGV